MLAPMCVPHHLHGKPYGRQPGGHQLLKPNHYQCRLHGRRRQIRAPSRGISSRLAHHFGTENPSEPLTHSCKNLRKFEGKFLRELKALIQKLSISAETSSQFPQIFSTEIAANLQGNLGTFINFLQIYKLQLKFREVARSSNRDVPIR